MDEQIREEKSFPKGEIQPREPVKLKYSEEYIYIYIYVCVCMYICIYTGTYIFNHTSILQYSSSVGSDASFDAVALSLLLASILYLIQFISIFKGLHIWLSKWKVREESYLSRMHTD
jgi:hypothetical protein